MRDRVYGSIFYLRTGFHGLHVLVGGLFLFVNLYRGSAGLMRTDHHIGFEGRIWYWHFVDVV